MTLPKGFSCFVSIWNLLKITLLCDATLKLSAPTLIVVGQNVTLSCTSDKDLPSTSAVKWTRNSVPVLSITLQNNKRNVSKTTYGNNCDTTAEKDFCLNIPANNVTEKQHGSLWRCYIAAGLSSNVLRLNVSVPVENVTLTTSSTDTDDITNITIEAGKKVEFTCTTGSSRPAVQEYGIQWFRNNKKIIEKSNITIIPADDDKFITSTKLFIQGNITDEDSDIFCSVWNLNGRTSIQSNFKKLVVLEKPSGNATITGYMTSFWLHEDSTLILNCSVLGGKPLAVLTWSGICSRYEAKNKTLPGMSVSQIMISVNRSYNGRNCTCTAKHPVKSYRSSQSVTFTVAYPPTLQVKLQNSTEHSSKVRIHCIGDGVPNNITITSWTQNIAGTIVRTTKDFKHVSEDKTVIFLSNVNFEDTGLYTCKAKNGIPDRNNIQEQSGSFYLDVKASAKYQPYPDKLEFYGNLGKQLSIKVPFYSNPKATEKQVSWFKKTSNKNVLLSPSSLSVPSSLRDITFSLVEGVNITLTVFGKLVTLQGQAAEMNISTFRIFHRGNYSLTIKDYENLESSTNVIINPTGPPETPKSFTFLSITSNTIILHWERGFNGGHKQKFVVNFTETESIKHAVDSREILEMDIKSDYYMTVNNLKPDTTYNITLYAYNQVGFSPFQSILASTNKEATVSTAVIFVAVAGVSSALILSFITGAILLKKPLARNKGNKENLLQVRCTMSQDDEPDDGMKPNIIYESAGPYFAAQSNNSRGNSDFDYIVQNAATDRKQNAVYAVVNKARKPSTNSGASGCAEPDQTYDNWKGNVNNMGEKGDVGVVQTKPSRKKNKDGLDYIEVVLKDTNSDQSVRVIHGIENRNDYADIDFFSHADPLPFDDEEDVRPYVNPRNEPSPL